MFEVHAVRLGPHQQVVHFAADGPLRGVDGLEPVLHVGHGLGAGRHGLGSELGDAAGDSWLPML